MEARPFFACVLNGALEFTAQGGSVDVVGIYRFVFHRVFLSFFLAWCFKWALEFTAQGGSVDVVGIYRFVVHRVFFIIFLSFYRACHRSS